MSLSPFSGRRAQCKCCVNVRDRKEGRSCPIPLTARGLTVVFLFIGIIYFPTVECYFLNWISTPLRPPLHSNICSYARSCSSIGQGIAHRSNTWAVTPFHANHRLLCCFYRAERVVLTVNPLLLLLLPNILPEPPVLGEAGAGLRSSGTCFGPGGMCSVMKSSILSSR